MKQLYHICITSHKEILFRSPNDYRWAHNCLAVWLHRYDSSLMANAFMSNHIHLIALTQNPHSLVKSFRISYTRYFNRKYLRSGPLGEKNTFVQPIIGAHHTLAAISYCVRNGVHHGVCSAPFQYPWCSVRAYYKNEFAHNEELALKGITFAPYKEKDFFESFRMRFPPHFELDTNGFVKYECFTEIQNVRLLYGSVRRFSFFLTRPSGKEWEQEQLKDNNKQVCITLERFEAKTKADSTRLHGHETNLFQPVEVNDWVLCELIDNTYLPKLNKPSYTHLSQREKESIAKHLLNNQKVHPTQLGRCLCLK